MTDIVMPRLTDSMEEGTILSWLKQSGDEVAVGEELVEIETDKASMTYESDAAGTLKILVEADTTLPIGETIAIVGDPDEIAAASRDTAEGDGADSASGGDEGAVEGDSSGRPSPGVPEESPSTAPSGTGPREEGAVGGPAGTRGEISPAKAGEVDNRPANSPTGPARTTGERIKASPLARRIAADRGVDLGSLSGSGPGGRIIKLDIERAAATPAAKPETARAAGERGEVETVELSRIQKTIAHRMAESKATIPHFTLHTEVDMRRAVAVREAFKQESGAEEQPVPSFNDLVVKASARALRLHPRANAGFEDDTFRLYSRVNVGIAVAAEDSLIVPVVDDADRLGLREIAAESRRLAGKVRSGEISPGELAGGTFTVSNLGMFGVRSFDAVIVPGQAGILTVGELVERPVIEDGQTVAGTVMELSLSCDHRILYGADGALFLAAVKAGLEEPGLLA